jgi:hypothetical protein
MELLFLKMQFMPERMMVGIMDGYIRNITESGISEQRLKQIMPATNLVSLLSRIQTTSNLTQNVKLEPYEERIVKAAITKATPEGMKSMVSDSLAPDSIVFFEIKNTGNRDAKNPHIVVHLQGRAYSVDFFSDNKKLSEETKSSQYHVDLASIAPNTRTRGIIWVGPCFDANKSLGVDKSEITISFDNGFVRQEIKENEFFSK